MLKGFSRMLGGFKPLGGEHRKVGDVGSVDTARKDMTKHILGQLANARQQALLKGSRRPTDGTRPHGF